MLTVVVFFPAGHVTEIAQAVCAVVHTAVLPQRADGRLCRFLHCGGEANEALQRLVSVRCPCDRKYNSDGMYIKDKTRLILDYMSAF